MDIVVGGSFHKDNWGEVRTTIEMLNNSGHHIVAPGGEWEPINLDDEFVKFKGEETVPREVLQGQFYGKINEIADVFVVVDKDGYIGETVINEILDAMDISQVRVKLKAIYFTETPFFYEIFNNAGLHYKDFVNYLLANREDNKRLIPLVRQNWEKYNEIYRQMCGNPNISFVIGIDNLTRNHSNNLRPSKPADDIEYE